MFEQSSTVIIHSHWNNCDGSLSYQGEARVKKGIELFVKRKTLSLTMPGGYATIGVEKTNSESMKQYALKAGIEERFIYSEHLSLDTVGEAIFTKLGIVLPYKFKNIIAVSHRYHISRLRNIYEFVYGLGFNIRYEEVKSDLDNDLTLLSKEYKSLTAFHKTFEGVTPGNDVEILERLFEFHPLYKGRTDLQDALQEMIRSNSN